MNPSPTRGGPGHLGARLRPALLLALGLCAGLIGWRSAKDPPKATLIRVRHREGAVHGFVELRNQLDQVIAHGDLLQAPTDSTVEIRLVLRFVDRSVFEETTVFTQDKTFRLRSYRLVQRGPAFGRDLDASLDAGGQYRVVTKSHHDGDVDHHDGRLDLPADVANGLPVTLAKNLSAGDTATVHLVAFMPKPRLVGLRFAYAGADSVTVGSRSERLAHFVLSPRLGTFTKFFAKLLGKLPPDSHLWIITDEVPAFGRFEGPMYDGPVWRLDLATPTWRRPGGGPKS